MGHKPVPYQLVGGEGARGSYWSSVGVAAACPACLHDGTWTGAGGEEGEGGR